MSGAHKVTLYYYYYTTGGVFWAFEICYSSLYRPGGQASVQVHLEDQRNQQGQDAGNHPCRSHTDMVKAKLAA